MSAVPNREDQGELDAASKAPRGSRFKAWWNGTDPSALSLDAANDELAGDGSADANGKAPRVPFLLRLLAWWHGVTAQELANRGEEGETQRSAAAAKKT